MVENNVEVERVINEIEDTLNQVNKEQLNLLGKVIDFQACLRSLLVIENKRIAKKLGKDHPRTIRLRHRLKHNLNIIKDLEIEFETANIKTPEVEEKDVVLWGQIKREKILRGISDLIVSLTDEMGKPLFNLGKSETDNSGSFFIKIGPDTLNNFSEVIQKGVYLSVFNRRNKRIHVEYNPLKLVEGAREKLEINLNVNDLVPTEGKTKKKSDSKVKNKNKEFKKNN